MERIKVDLENNSVVLSFNPDFYGREFIDQALADFFNVCDSRWDGSSLVLTPKAGTDISRLGHEFYNYVFGLMKNSGFAGSGKSYAVNHYREMRINDKYLLTTDHGSWVVLDEEHYNSFKEGNLDSHLFSLLRDKGFIISGNFDNVVCNYRRKCSFLFSGTSLHIVIPTLRCNQGCVYCHANSKSSDAKGCDMDESVAKKTVDFIFQSPSKNIAIEFQGGEPLLNFGLVKYMVGYAKEKNKLFGKDLQLRLVTNLVSMTDEILDFIMREKIGLCTSLDGPELVHNRNRGDYDKVVAWVERIKKVYPLNAMMVVTRNSLPYHREIIDEYVRLGFDAVWLRPAEPIGRASSSKDSFYSPEEFLDFWKKSLAYLLEVNRERLLVENYSRVLLRKVLWDGDANFADLQSPCGAAISQLAYNYDGSIYTCDEGRQYDVFKLGTVDSSYKDVLASKDVSSIVTASINDSFVCDKCAFKPFCGVCPVCSYATSGDIVTRFPNSRCEIFKGMFEFIFEKLTSDKEYSSMFMKWLGAQQK